MRAIALGVCDYLAGLAVGEDGRRRSLDPHLEAAVSTVVKNMILNGLRDHTSNPAVPLEMAAAAIGWAIYGGAREWLEAAARASSESAATTILALVSPILSVLAEDQPGRTVSEDFASGAGNRRAA